MRGIEIIHKGTENLGRCYTRTSYEIKSSQPIDKIMFDTLVDLGFVTNGQGKGIYQVVGSEKVAVPDKMEWNTKIEPTIKLECQGDNGYKYYRNEYHYSVSVSCDSGD